MKDESLSVIKQLAVKLTIENTDGIVKFKYYGQLKKDGKEYHNPTVIIPEEILDKVITEDSSNLEEIKSLLQIVE